MTGSLNAACIIADILTKDKSLPELMELQATLQAISSLVSAQIAVLRSGT